MHAPVSDPFFDLYLIVDIVSRTIVGWEVPERESADLPAAPDPAGRAGRRLYRTLNQVPHADNGSPIQPATMTVTIETNWGSPQVQKPPAHQQWQSGL